jgi:hypothetical protein
MIERGGCVDCDDTNFLTMEADHVRGKKVCDVSRAKTLRILLEELAKTVNRCKFCHRLKTKSERGKPWNALSRERKIRRVFGWILKRRALDRFDGKCYHCHRPFSENVSAAFDWDHLPGSTKLFQIGETLASSAHTIEEIVEEIKKCRMVCCSCHWIWTLERRGERLKEPKRTLVKEYVQKNGSCAPTEGEKGWWGQWDWKKDYEEAVRVVDAAV